jgi:hypothetical protein
MREANYAIPLYLHRGVASTIVLECVPVAMEGPAVRLHHQLLGGPEGVNLATEDHRTGRGQGEVVLATDLKHLILQGGLRVLGHARDFDQLADRLQGSPPMPTRTDRFELRQAEQSQSIRLLKRSFKLLLGDNFGQVEERAPNGGNGNAGYFCPIHIDDAALMNCDPAPAAA